MDDSVNMILIFFLISYSVNNFIITSKYFNMY